MICNDLHALGIHKSTNTIHKFNIFSIELNATDDKMSIIKNSYQWFMTIDYLMYI